MHSNITRPQSVAPSGNYAPMHPMPVNAAQALFHYKNSSPGLRAMTSSFHVPSTPGPYSSPRSTTLALSPSPTPAPSSPLARQLPLTSKDVTIQSPIPKARNAFIMYRSHYISSGKAKGVRLQNDISRLAADSWRELDKDEKEMWTQKAAEEKKVRDEIVKALEDGCMLSPSRFVAMPVRTAPAGKKARAKKDRTKAAAAAAALKKEHDSAKRAERRKVDLKKVSPVSLSSRAPSVSPIHLPKLIHSPLVGSEPSTSSTVVPPSSRVSSVEPFVVDPHTLLTHTYDSPLDAEYRNASPSPANFQRVAGAIQIIEPSTHTLYAPPLPPLSDFQSSMENPWLGSRDMFAGAQRVPRISVQPSTPAIQLSKALRESALARRQGQMIMWPRSTMQQGRMTMPCIDPRMLGAIGAFPSPQAINPPIQAPHFSTQTPLAAMTTPPGLASPFDFLPARNAPSPSDFATSPVTPEDGFSSPFAGPSSYSFSRTPSPFGMPNTSYVPAPDTYLYGGLEVRSDSVPLSKTAIANKQIRGYNSPQPRVMISTPQTDVNNEWANAGDGNYQWLTADALPDAGMNIFGEQDLSNLNMMGMGMDIDSTAM